MKYQDTWVNGRVIEKGIRDCESRYNIIKKYCSTINKEFVICDIGANMNYFGNRLIEDFNCKVIAFEFNDYINRFNIIKKQKTDKLMYINRKLSLNDILILKGVIKFDVILALSVLHHVKEPIDEWIEALLKISDNLIIEYADKDARKPNVKNLNYTNKNYEILGYAKSHINNNINRKIVIYKNHGKI